MGIRCSLVGHDWGESEIERDRDEQGSEVVLTVREYEVCTRCEERNLISENTEVTTLATEGDAEGAAPEGRAPEPTRGDAAAGDASAPEAADDAPTADTSADAPPAEVDADAPPAEADDDAPAAEVDADAPPTDTKADAPAAEVDADAPPADTEADAPAAGADAGGDDAVFIDEADEDDRDVATAEEIVQGAAEPVDDAAPDAHADADAPAGEAGAGDPSAVEGEAPDAAEEAAADAGPGAGEDDGVILDDEPAPEPDAGERGHGEWPEGPDQDDAGDVADVDVEQFNEEPAAETAADVDADAGAQQAAAAGGQAEPEAAEERPIDEGDAEDGYDAEVIDGDAAAEAESEPSHPPMGDSPSGIKSAGSTAPPGERQSRSGELVCPNCSNTESADRTSLRAGDICPECKKGYLSDGP